MFKPPFCPYKTCRLHAGPQMGRWWRKAGIHHTRCFGPVCRFRCRTCGRTFSSQTFSVDFFAKRKIDYGRLEELNASSVGVRALSVILGCSPGSVLNRFDRLARQALACHSRLRPRARASEDVCIDGFVSFDRSQYFPNNITIAITAESRYVLSCTHATLRRSGRLRPSQKRRRDELYRNISFEPKSLERSFRELLDVLERERPPLRDRPLIVITDEKHEYGRAFRGHRLFRHQDEEHRAVHLRVNSRLPRIRQNPLFPSNYLDREIRKDQAAHRRETTCFSRSAANSMSRLTCYVSWHNYAKRFLIKAPADEVACHAEVAGIGVDELRRARQAQFRDRAFLSLEGLDDLEKKIWRKDVTMPGRKSKPYLAQYAFG